MSESDCKTQKHKWFGPSEMSPDKYLKGTRSRLARKVVCTKGDGSEHLNMTSNRLLVLSDREAGAPKRPCSGTHNNEVISPNPVSAKQRCKRGQTSSPDRPETAAELHTGHSAASRRECGGARKTEPPSDHKARLNCDGPSCRKPRAHDPTMIFKRAFRDIIGTSSRAKPLLSSDRERSAERDHNCGSDEFLGGRFAPAADSAKRSERLSAGEVQNNTSKACLDSSTLAEVCPDKSEADIPEKDKRLVFLCEDDSDEDPDTGSVSEKNPSIGSDFSDVDDVCSLARFSQDDPVVSCCSMSENPPYVCEDLSHKYNDPCPSGLASSPSSGEGTWLQTEPKSSQLSEHFMDWLEKPVLGVSRNWESPGSFHSTPTYKTVGQRRKSDSFVCSPSSKYLEDGFIDTHCHLDMLFAKLSFDGSFAEFRRNCSTTFSEEFQGCITDFCCPDTLPDLQWQRLLEEDMVWGAFGCHPHFAQYFTDRKQDEIMMALRHPKAVAYGEMGLDYSHKCSSEIPVQQKVFEDQLQKALLLRKPLVIHCRDAEEDLFRIMKKLVPADYKIHRHCFTGSYAQIEPFLNEFPNMAIGFTALVTYSSAAAARAAVTQIPLERLIVETDAPYFVPRQVPKSLCKFAHPGLALHTIHEIARLRNLPVKDVLSALRKNTRRLYNL